MQLEVERLIIPVPEQLLELKPWIWAVSLPEGSETNTGSLSSSSLLLC